MVIKGGIARDANNRSSMLWEIERILIEREKSNLDMPRFLLMENVRSIMSKNHMDNFKDWQKSLKNMGYENYTLKLNSSKFGIPQKRVRVYMISVLVGKDEKLKKKVDDFFKKNDLEQEEYIKNLSLKSKKLKDILKVDYTKQKYKDEANESQPNDTKSRRDILAKNCKLYDKGNYFKAPIPTLTTKQDRHPNSGVIMYDSGIKNKSKFRYLTPREGFLLMGFEEKDYQIIVDNNIKINEKRNFFTRDKLNKMAGNSIVVNVLEEIFKQIDYIDKNIF